MKLAVVMPCYNQFESTERSIETLFLTTKTDFVLILIDDCSSDNTKNCEERFKQRFRPERVIYHRNEQNLGVNASWNVGIKIAKELQAEYIAIVNNDVLFTPEWDIPIIEALQDKTIGVVSPLCTNYRIPKDWPKGAERAPNPAGYLGYMPILGACFVSRADLYDSIGLFPESLRIYYGDNWIALASQVKGYKCGYVDSYVHHLMCQSTSKLNNSSIWPIEQPIFREIGRKFGEKDACSVNNTVFKPFVKKGESWKNKMRTWRK